MAKKYINVQYPFKNSVKGFYVELSETDKDAIKSDLMHLILTEKGKRYYNPNFGTNLIKFLFETNDGLTESGIREEISLAVNTYIPSLKINNITIDRNDMDGYKATIKIDYTVTEDTFQASDTVIINI